MKQGKIKKLEHDARESVVRTEARGAEREELENKLAEAEVRPARYRPRLFFPIVYGFILHIPTGGTRKKNKFDTLPLMSKTQTGGHTKTKVKKSKA